MTLSNAIIATIAAESDGKLRGRTLLHKKLYFLSILTGQDFGFNPYYYGPYSSEVSGQLESLVAAGLIQEDMAALAEASGRMFEQRTYSYELTEVGKQLLPRIQEQLAPYLDLLKKINADNSVSHSVRRLAVAAKMYLIVSERSRATSEEIKRRARELGWNLSDWDIDAVEEYLKGLDLISSAPTVATRHN